MIPSPTLSSSSLWVASVASGTRATIKPSPSFFARTPSSGDSSSTYSDSPPPSSCSSKLSSATSKQGFNSFLPFLARSNQPSLQRGVSWYVPSPFRRQGDADAFYLLLVLPVRGSSGSSVCARARDLACPLYSSSIYMAEYNTYNLTPALAFFLATFPSGCFHDDDDDDDHHHHHHHHRERLLPPSYLLRWPRAAATHQRDPAGCRGSTEAAQECPLALSFSRRFEPRLWILGLHKTQQSLVWRSDE